VQEWISNVGKGLDITYAPIGSGGGINAITGRTFDFGASDAPLTADQFREWKGCVQIPWVLSATSVPRHIEGPDRESVREGQAGPSDCNVHLGDRSAADIEGAGAAVLRRLAITKGQVFGPSLIFQPLPKVVKAAAQRTLVRIHA
jgi:hypothetical protein